MGDDQIRRKTERVTQSQEDRSKKTNIIAMKQMQLLLNLKEHTTFTINAKNIDATAKSLTKKHIPKSTTTQQTTHSINA